jgi:hypothetical protein
MAMTKEEAQFRLVEHISTILYYFLADADASDEENEELDDSCLDIAAIVAATIGLEVSDVIDENSVQAKLTIQDPVKFIEALTGQ